MASVLSSRLRFRNYDGRLGGSGTLRSGRRGRKFESYHPDQLYRATGPGFLPRLKKITTESMGRQDISILQFLGFSSTIWSMNVAKKKRPVGRPKNVNKTIPKLINYREAAVHTLAALTERYGRDAPIYFTVTDRTVLEALILYADREKLPFEVLFDITADAAK